MTSTISNSGLIEETAKKAVTLFNDGYFCAESVLIAITESYNIQSDLIPKIATGFCSGLSRTSGLCGAISGAVMAISVLAGRTEPHQSVEEPYEMVGSLIEQFQKRYNSTNCYDLIECDFSKQEGHVRFEKENLIEQCNGYVSEVVRLVFGLLQEYEIDMNNTVNNSA